MYSSAAIRIGLAALAGYASSHMHTRTHTYISMHTHTYRPPQVHTNPPSPSCLVPALLTALFGVFRAHRYDDVFNAIHDVTKVRLGSCTLPMLCAQHARPPSFGPLLPLPLSRSLTHPHTLALWARRTRRMGWRACWKCMHHVT
jgi:hypothetical protein